MPVPMRDGVRLRADVWRPAGQSALPVVILRTPYNKTRADAICMLHPSWLARRGYAVVVQDCRGRWSSEGRFVPFLHEADDTEDTIAWAAGLPVANGRVGMYGFSYAGALQLQAAVRRPESLLAICPAMTGADFRNGWIYTNGALALAFAASWATALAEDIARRQGSPTLASEYLARYAAPDELYWTLPLSTLPGLRVGDPGGFFAEWLAREADDDYWQRLNVERELAGIRAATLFVGGLYDSFLEGTVEAYQRVGDGPAADDSRLVLGPWHHMPWSRAFGASDFGAQAGNRVNELQLAFFDQWLRDLTPVTAGARAFLTGANRWEELERWPPFSTPWTLHLRSSSRANSLDGDGWLSEEEPGAEAPDVFTYDPAEPVPSRGGHSCCTAMAAPMGPADQGEIEALNDVLVYTTEPLPEDRYVAGTIRASLYASTSARDTDWTVKVCDVDPAGRSLNLQESIQRARFAQSSQRAQLLRPHEVNLFHFEVGTCSHVFRAGHRVRVLISSSDFPQWDRNLGTANPIGVDPITDRVVATQAVFHESAYPSAVTLPLVAH